MEGTVRFTEEGRDLAKDLTTITQITNNMMMKRDQTKDDDTAVAVVVKPTVRRTIVTFHAINRITSTSPLLNKVGSVKLYLYHDFLFHTH